MDEEMTALFFIQEMPLTKYLMLTSPQQTPQSQKMTD